MIGKSLYLGEGVDLTALDAEKDAAVLSGWTVSPAFFTNFDEGYFRLIPEFEMKKKISEKLKKAEEKRNAFIFGIRKHGTNELVGYTAITWILYSHQVGYFHIYFADAGSWAAHGDEAMRLILRYAFMEASLNRLEAVLPANWEEHVQLLEKHGFLREVQRREACYHNGSYVDQLVYGLLKSDYKKTLVEAKDEKSI